MHDNEYLINAGTDRGESDPVSVRGIPVDIQYAKMMGGADPLPKPGYTMVRFPDEGFLTRRNSLLLRGSGGSSSGRGRSAPRLTLTPATCRRDAQPVQGHPGSVRRRDR